MGKYTYDQNGTPYQLKGSKHPCPCCGQYKLQLYLRVEDDEPISEDVGKCDRHYKCGYDYKPKDYYSDHPQELPRKADRRRAMPKPEPPKTLITIPAEYVRQSRIMSATWGQCDFTDILLKMFTRKDVERVYRLYHVGRTKDKSVIFWQIDENDRTHEGKAMAYDYAKGSHLKKTWSTGESKWIFSTLQDRGILPDGESIKILFGQHLLRYANYKTKVCITESEKNAIFGALAFPNYTWLAVGSKQEFGKIWKVRKILAKCSCVIIVPDSDAFNDWSREAEKLKLPNLKVWNLCQGHADGWDIADYISDIWLQKPQLLKAYQPTTTITTPPMEDTTHIALCPQRRLERMAANNPAIALLVSKLQLEAIDDDFEPF